MSDTFRAMVIDSMDGKPRAGFRALSLGDLPDHDVLVEIGYSSLNYKDGLPMVAGIDLAGTVVESRSPQWSPGDRVIVNGFGLSETEWGAYSRFQRLKPEWLLRLPDRFDMKDAMAIGTAGYTAALCVNALETFGIEPDKGPVLVTGAAGGVGSVATSLLASKGYQVSAATGRAETASYLRTLGASEIVERASLAEPGKPLQAERWAAAVDTVGSTILANVLSQIRYGGAVAACGMVGGADVHISIFPHILRGVALLGVDSVHAPMKMRDRAWATLADHLDREKLSSITRVEPFDRLPELADEIVAGKVKGRIVIDLGA